MSAYDPKRTLITPLPGHSILPLRWFVLTLGGGDATARVHAHEHDVSLRALRVRDQLLVLGLEEVDVVEPLEGGVLAADRVQPLRRAAAAARRARASSPRTSPSRGTPRCPPAPARSRSLVAGVDAVARRQRRREHEPRLERRPAAALEVLVEDVRRVGEEVRPEELGSVGRSARVMYSISSALRVLPREVGVGLAEARLRERAIIAGRVNASARKTTSGSTRAHLADQPLPERAAASCAGCRRGRP